MSGLGGLELVVLIVVAGLVLLTIAAIVDAAGRPAAQWDAAGQNKTLWIVLLVVGTFLFGIGGIILAIVYFASVRPKLQAS